MHPLATLLKKNELWLMRRIRDYAAERGYTKYTPTLEEAWRISIVGITNSISAALSVSDKPWELSPDDDYIADSVAAFGVLEAQKHRARGITLEMFLGLMKYYRQSYLDLIWGSFPNLQKIANSDLIESELKLDGAVYARFIERAFDRIEIALCSEWSCSETVDKAVDSLQLANRDITNEKNKFLTIFESLPLATFLIDDQRRIVNMNHSAALMLDPSATYGGYYYSGHEKQILFPWLAEELKRFHECNDESEFELPIEFADGNTCDVSVRLHVMQDVSFKYPGILVILKDITDKKQAEWQMESLTQRLLLATSSAQFGVWDWNLKDNSMIWDDRMFELYGVTREETPGNIEAWENYLHPEDKEAAVAECQAALEGELEFDTEFRICTPGGQIKHLKSNGLVIRREDGKAERMIGITADITGRKKAEADRQELENQLHQAQKIESIGRLAGGVAHDFNNVLTSLYGNIALAKMKLAKDHPGFRFLEAAEESMLRTTLLTNRLLTFAKGGAPVIKSLNLVSLIEEVVNLSLSGSNVKPVITSATNLWQVRVDQRQIEQVFANLTANAREAMPDGGHLYITMENAELADKAEHGLIGGKYLQITVTDEGTGIEPELLDKIFDPYFTTKPTGSGLGLATVYSIINRHGGKIIVASQLGKGATFTLSLPAAEVTEETSLKQSGTAQMQFAQGARILVMDDEEMIRNMLKELLGELGFAVETAVEGQHAIDMYHQAMDAGQPFAIVILDLTIPGGMCGQETAKGILQIDPEAKVIVSSGYSDDPIVANYTDYGFKGVASKPYSLTKLSGVLTQVMAKE